MLARPFGHVQFEGLAAARGAEKIEQHGAQIGRHTARAGVGHRLPQVALGADVVAVGKSHSGLFHPGHLQAGGQRGTVDDEGMVAGRGEAANPSIVERMLAPIFHRGRIVGFAGSIAHSPDVGGALWSADCRELFEEGIRIPPSRLFRAGKRNEDLAEVLRKDRSINAASDATGMSL